MDDNTLSALRTQLVRLIINQGTIFSNWIKFAITVQGALAAGLGFALSDAKYRVFGLIMALLGIVTSLGFAAILVRQAQSYTIRRCLEHPLRWPAFQRVAYRIHEFARVQIRQRIGGIHREGHAVHGAVDAPVGGCGAALAPKRNFYLIRSGYLDRNILTISWVRTEAFDCAVREIDNDALRDRLRFLFLLLF